MARITFYSKPSTLYRYRPIDDETVGREISAILDDYIYCSAFTSMNDPMEGNHRESSLFKKSAAYEKQKSSFDQERNAVGIACLSESYKIEPMWAHYAKGFCGICVAYSVRELLTGLDKSIELIRMNYSETAPILLKNSEPTHNRVRLSLSSKTLRWSYEREWRLISPNTGPAKYPPATSIKRIYLGNSLSKVNREKILAAAKEKGVKTSEMKIGTYQLNFTRNKNK